MGNSKKFGKDDFLIKKLFLFFFGAIVLVLGVIFIGVWKIFPQYSVYVLTTEVVVLPLIIVVTLINGYAPVSHNYEYVVEVFGKYWKSLKSGFHILFPWFGFLSLKDKIFMGVQTLQLYQGDKVKDVEFKNTSASIAASFLYKVADSEKVAYAALNLEDIIEELLDHVVRGYLSQFTIDQAIELKTKFSLERMVLGKKVDSNEDADKLKRDFKESDFFKTLSGWGIEPISILVTDINLSEDIKAGRKIVFDAEQQLQTMEVQKKVAKAEADKRIIEAKGRKKAAVLEGEGEGGRLEVISKFSGVGPNKAANYVILSKKWEQIGKNSGNVSIIDGSNMAELGAAFGAGASAGSSTQTKKEKKEEHENTLDKNKKKR